MMLGMYVAYLSLHRLRRAGRFRQHHSGPFVAVVLAGPVLFVVRLLRPPSLISRVTGTRASSLEGEGHYAQLILTLGIALILQNGGLIVFGSMLVSIRTPLSSRPGSSAACSTTSASSSTRRAASTP